jgi:YHS domain-containing protein
MTAPRHERKSQRFWAPGVALALAVMVLGHGLRPQPTGAATTERIVADYRTGLAISGFDPVAYFIDGRPVMGRSEFELRLDGVTWRFRNEGNRAAFAADPDVYMPRFGGYDPVGLARGASAPGHPELWLIEDERLYLFYSMEARARFANKPHAAINAAERRWPEVLRTLTP